MRSILDVSILLAQTDRQHLHHAMAEAWLLSNAALGWATCPLTQNGFLRIGSQQRYEHFRPLGEAVALLNTWTARPDHEFWPDDL